LRWEEEGERDCKEMDRGIEEGWLEKRGGREKDIPKGGHLAIFYLKLGL
jgi:hypothetical protein